MYFKGAESLIMRGKNCISSSSLKEVPFECEKFEIVPQGVVDAVCLPKLMLVKLACVLLLSVN